MAVTIDTFAPTAPVVTGINPDTGSSSTDGITTATSFLVNGTAESNSTVTVFDGGTALGTAIANSSGAWSFNVAGPLAPGSTHFYTAKAADLAGNVSAVSGAFKVVIDSSGPTIPLISGITTDSGRSQTDGITSDQTLTINGTSDANDTVKVFDGAFIRHRQRECRRCLEFCRRSYFIGWQHAQLFGHGDRHRWKHKAPPRRLLLPRST